MFWRSSSDLEDMPDAVVVERVKEKYAALRPSWHERARRLWAATEARSLGRGGIAAVIAATGMSSATVEELPDGLIIRPPDRLTPAAIDTYDDHRMAMSFALAGLKCPGLVINDPQCCAKTFPDFFERFERMTAFGSGPARGSS